ncbi:MAG TPA: hypothetical protein VJ327_01730 [Patescibacteria group bacterium]|nr:hypothetical protein [Patescibacteria group bacterium]
MNPIRLALDYLCPPAPSDWHNIAKVQPAIDSLVILWDGKQFSTNTYYGTDGKIYLWCHKHPDDEGVLFWYPLPHPPNFTRGAT